jgi:hypothetical protein
VVLNWLMASRRAYADEYAVRVNRAVELLADVSPADAVRALQAEHALSERQARRMVNAALERPDGVTVPERTTVFTVRLAPSLIAGLRRHARSRGHPRIPRLPAPEQGCLCDNERRGRPEVVTRARRCCSTPIRVTPACWPLRTRRSDLIEGAQVIATVAKHARPLGAPPALGHGRNRDRHAGRLRQDRNDPFVADPVARRRTPAACLGLQSKMPNELRLEHFRDRRRQVTFFC